MIPIGYALAAIAYIGTVAGLLIQGDAGLAVLALVIPPADLVLAFVVSPVLGAIGILSVVFFLIGAATSTEQSQYR